jgi:hypothetical protein
MFEFSPISPAPLFIKEIPIELIVYSCLLPIGAFVGAFG